MNVNKDDELLVIVKNEGRFYWFVAFKEMWVLDRVKWIDDFVKNGVEINLQDIHKERYDIPVVNEKNAQIFIGNLIKDGYLYDKDDIAEAFYNRLSEKTTWWDIYDLMPDLFIDFESKRLYSEYVESMHYYKYVPDGWFGELVDFCSDGSLPQDEMFWIKNETDYRSVVIAKG
ncbi:hypothetical protein ABKV78_16585 [Enterobacter asburiae]|jgi:hypothetical protein|uniref:Group-specific protein n=1 Tax=Enterobacter asburiae TaxID=61645 RepID=A0A376FCH9_ENTAS|nr:hypothetical protein [Enterobacter asburiae]QLO47985.1 hypothetical protein HV216_13500 [Enterobacter cloacae]AMA03688.1 hypothetical protein ACJ69_08515 [Enterobacter asburiae]ELZ5051081.1 hypothetical protein [Enterobacter asburiae]MCM7019002.1 hypothetical protein [Enterobacter asburiae]QLR29126.1 hypothetical protein HV349_12420 [Enterobacter asburiae]